MIAGMPNFVFHSSRLTAATTTADCQQNAPEMMSVPSIIPAMVETSSPIQTGRMPYMAS